MTLAIAWSHDPGDPRGGWSHEGGDSHGHRGIKTDARDARALSEASARVELASVHIPSELSREMKACAGMREVLVRCRTKLVNNVRGWLRGRLIRGLTASTANFPARLRAHFAQQGRELPPYLERQLDTIDGINERIAAADAEINRSKAVFARSLCGNAGFAARTGVGRTNLWCGGCRRLPSSVGRGL